MRGQKTRIAIVVTSHSDLGDTGKKTGYHLEELAVPYLEFKKAGAQIVIASPQGGQPPVDPNSAKQDSPEIQEFLNDPEARKQLKNTIKVSDVGEDIDVLFFPGGHGPMWDLADSRETAELIEQVWRDGGIVAALCHGPAALIHAKDANGKALVAGKKINSYTDAEEKAGPLYGVVPFHLEAKLRELGARFESSGKQQAHVARDGRLITGQNPASAKGVAQEVLRVLDSDAASAQGDAVPIGRDALGSGIARAASGPGPSGDGLDGGRVSFDRRRVSTDDGERASNGRVVSAAGDDEEIASRYRGGHSVSQRGSESGHSLGKTAEERDLPSPDLEGGRIEAREASSGRGITPEPDGNVKRGGSSRGRGRGAPEPDGNLRDAVGIERGADGESLERTSMQSSGAGSARRNEGGIMSDPNRTVIPDGADDRLPTGVTADPKRDPNPPRSATLGRKGDIAGSGAVLHDDLPRDQQKQLARTEKQEKEVAEAAHLQDKKSAARAKTNKTPQR